MADYSPIELSRDALYERVWSEPMAVLAPQLGLSDVGLKKTCARMRIPTPPRGYWARVAAGQRLRRTPLPKLPASAGTGIQSATFRRPQPVGEPKPEEAGPVADQRRFEADPANAIVVAAQLTDPHPLVARAVRALRKAKPDEQGRLVTRGHKILSLSVTRSSVDRALRICDALFKALLSRGYAVALVETGELVTTVIAIGQELVPITLVEQVDRTLLPPKTTNTWEPKRYSFAPTGRLSLSVTESYLDVRGKWSDGARQRLHESLNEVLVGLVNNAEAMRRKRDEREAQARQWHLQEERRQRAELEKHYEAERVRTLGDHMRRWRKSRAVREYVAAVRASAEQNGQSTHEELTAWLAWADAYADRLDPTAGGRILYHRDEDAGARYSAWNAPAEDTSPIW